MQIKGKYSWVKHFDFMIVDLIALLLAFFTAYFIKFHTIAMDSGWERFIIIIVLLNLVITFVTNPYSGILRRRYYHEIGRTFLLVAANGLLVAFLFYLSKIGAEYSREVLIFTYVLYYVFSLVLKYFWKKHLRKNSSVQKVPLFLVSSVDNAERDIHSIYSTDLPLYEIKGIYLRSNDPTKKETGTSITYNGKREGIEVPVIQEDVVKYILDNNITEVVSTCPLNEQGIKSVQELIANGVSVDLSVESLLGFKTEEQFVSNIGVNKVLSIGAFSFSPAQNSYLIIKRLFDILCGLLGLVVLIPLSIIIKLSYLASGDTAKIFYRQKRVGLNGKPIRIWKFRSMVPNAEEILEEMLKEEKYRKEWDANQKFENDPRITRIGNFIRKTSLDELPQLLNVLVGDMSLVGPRPLVESELAAHNGLKLYEKVKPGITGWWGCNGRSNIDYNERLELEYYYVKNCSLYLDILCIVRTIYAVLRKDGAQ